MDLHVTVANEGGFPWSALISLIPDILWILALVGVLAWIGRSEIVTALRRMNKIGVAGVELGFRDNIAAALQAHSQTAPFSDIDRASRRLAANSVVVAGARILWVDDQPTNNRFEATLLESAGARIILAVSTEAAERELARSRFDLIISDIARGSQDDAGLKMAQSFADRGVDIPVILYTGIAEKPVPRAAFGITDRPDELVHLVLDALARRRG